jgi:hypothetical protein
MACTFSDETFVTAWTINKVKCDEIVYNFYLGLLAVLNEGMISIIAVSDFTMTHQIAL